MRYIVGVDEVGRGPLAGPVTVCAAAFPAGFSFKKAAKTLGLRLRDSKRLTEAQRETWLAYLKSAPGFPYAVSSISPKRIDQINIRNATNEAVGSAITMLMQKNKLSPADTYICMDGGLEIPDRCIRKLGLRRKPQSIIRGDATVPAIAAASIIAKVARDLYMKRIARRYKKYGFERHKGYGTPEHYRALRQHGPSAIHRRSFLKSMQMGYDT